MVLWGQVGAGPSKGGPENISLCQMVMPCNVIRENINSEQ